MSVFLHIDLDAFFASVEQLDHPDWKGKPVIVGGLPGDRRAVVSTASYEARAFGVHSAMPLAEAVRRCPDGIFVRGNMKRYHEKSAEVMAIFQRYSPDVQQMSVDEAFIDLTGTERLFGPPEETARAIKEEVRTQTGLTVSVGMASNRYLAKIASGLQKPDGFCRVAPGEETAFMLALPLTKIWGAGEKTQARLRSLGLYTTRDIYTKSRAMLESVFGKAGGSFLYTAVRGLEAESFLKEAKTHSISSESTYAFDLTDRDAIDTALLELSYTVSFRLFREKLRTNAVSVKIRYDDFSTVSIQDSNGRDIMSTDDLYERVKQLFYKKYDFSHSIRLLGVAALNVTDSAAPRQKELFDFGEEKRRKVENAIFEAKQKNPSLHITKARLLRALLLPILAAASFLQLSAVRPLPLAAESALELETERESDGTGSLVFDTSALPLESESKEAALIETNIGGKDIVFSADGYWQALYSGEASYSFGFGSTPAFSSSAPVLSQKVDLSMQFLYDNHWFFKADFADEFETNTLSAGYTHGSGVIQEVRIANRGIVFPDFYAVDAVGRGIGGSESGTEEAPGISFQAGGSSWRADGAVRYDMLTAEEKTWYGKNSVSSSDIALSDWYTGSRYVLPSAESVTRVKAVYVENASGSLRDSDGRRYLKLDASQYLLSATSCSIYLARDAGASRKNGALPAIALVFDGALPDTESFIAETEAVFAIGGISSLEAYLAPLTGIISDESVLYVQHPAGFSVFAAANRYDAAITSENADALIISSSTKAASQSYTVTVSDDDSLFTTDDFFYASHTYVDITATDRIGQELTDPCVRFPFAASDPGVYLLSARKTDFVLSVRTYTAVTRFDIGTKAVSGTVRVYKNGMVDSGARYDEESGTITLSTSVSASDHIYATWYEASEDADTGALAGALGIQWTLSDTLSLDVASATRWTYAGGRTYASSDYSAPGFVTLASALRYTGTQLSFSNTVAATVETANTTGTWRLLSMDETESDWRYLKKNAAVDLPDGFVPSLNARKNDSTASLPELEAAKNGSTTAQTGFSDDSLPGGYAVPISWSFSPLTATGTEEAPYWAATALSLPSLASTLASSSRFTLYLKNAASTTDYTVYLQLGIQADDDFDAETVTKIPTWCVSADSSAAGQIDVYTPFVSTTDGWQQISVIICDEDRARIAQGTGARLIICSTVACDGALYAGAYKADGSAFSVSCTDGITVSATEETDATLTAKKVASLNSSTTNYVASFSWKSEDEVNADEAYIYLSHYFDEVDASGYDTLSLYLKSAELAEDATLSIVLDRLADDDDEQYLPCVSLSLPASALVLAQATTSWQELSVDLTAKTATLGGKALTVETCDTSVIPTRLLITIAQSTVGTLSIDELTLSGITPDVLLEDHLKAAWKKDGTVLSTRNGTALVRDAYLSAASTLAAVIPTGNGSRETSFATQAQAGVTVSEIALYLSLAHQNETSAALSSGSHRIETAQPLFSIFSASESYSFEKSTKTLSKANSASLDFAKRGLPLSFHTETAAHADRSLKTQKATAALSFTPASFAFHTSAAITQKISATTAEASKLANESYGSGWIRASSLAFGTGDTNAKRRSIALSSDACYTLPLLSFTPTITAAASGSYRTSSSTLFTDESSFSFALPFRVKKHTFTVSWEKTAGGVSYVTTGGSYASDTKALATSLQNKDWFLSAIPIYDMLSSSLSHKILSDTSATASSSESLYYDGSYSASWKRAVYGNAWDLIFPASVKATLMRSIHTSSSVSDFYQIKSTIGYTALNIFGTAGTIPVMGWFKQDEYAAQGSAALKIPRTGKNLSMLYTAYVQATFYVQKNNSFKTGLEAEYETKADWSGKLTAIWKRHGIVSPMAGLVDLFSHQELGAHAVLTRTDSIQLSAASVSATTSKSTTLTYSGKINHQLDMALSDTVTINTAVGASYTAVHESAMTICATASIGATIQF